MTLSPLKAGAPIGTVVAVVRDFGHHILITTTRSEVFLTGDGSILVSVEGISGGYAVERVFRFPDQLAAALLLEVRS